MDLKEKLRNYLKNYPDENLDYHILEALIDHSDGVASKYQKEWVNRLFSRKKKYTFRATLNGDTKVQRRKYFYASTAQEAWNMIDLWRRQYDNWPSRWVTIVALDEYDKILWTHNKPILYRADISTGDSLFDYETITVVAKEGEPSIQILKDRYQGIGLSIKNIRLSLEYSGDFPKWGKLDTTDLP